MDPTAAPAQPVRPIPAWKAGVFLAAVVASWAGAYVVAVTLMPASAKLVPDFVAASVPFFFVLMALEYWLGRDALSTAGKYDVSNSFSSVSAGAVQQLLQAAVLNKVSILYLPYTWIWAHVRVLPHMDESWALTYVVAFVAHDLQYYLLHRFAHENSVAWSFHSVHHSSDSYNLTTALRQGAGQLFTTFFFHLPSALLIPPRAAFLAAAWNTVYQFWVHTVLVRRLPLGLENLLMTPSHHRVHHDRRVHKNYGGMLIVWDKAFGTFLDEQGLLADGTEREAYGVVHAARTWDPLVAQFEAFASLLQRAALHASPSLWWRVLMVGPGYRPNMKTAVLPPIGPTVARIRRATQLQPATQAYVLAHFALAIAGAFAVLALQHDMPYRVLLVGVAASIANLVCIAKVLDADPAAWEVEAARCAAHIGALLYALEVPAAAVALGGAAWWLLAALLAAHTVSAAVLVAHPSAVRGAQVHFRTSLRDA